MSTSLGKAYSFEPPGRCEWCLNGFGDMAPDRPQDLEYIVAPHIIKSYLEGDQEVRFFSSQVLDARNHQESLGQNAA